MSGCALEGSIPIFLKVLLFHLSGRGNHHDDATLNFISDSSSCMLGLSNEISFVSVFFLEGGQNSQNVKLKNCLCRSICPPVYKHIKLISLGVI